MISALETMVRAVATPVQASCCPCPLFGLTMFARTHRPEVEDTIRKMFFEELWVHKVADLRVL